MTLRYRVVKLLGAVALLSCLAACGTKAVIESVKTDGFNGAPQRVFVVAAMPTVFPEGKGQDSATLFRTALHEQFQQCGVDSSVLLNLSQTYTNTDLNAKKPELRLLPDPHTVANPDYNLQLTEASKTQMANGAGAVSGITYMADFYDNKTKERVWRAKLILLPKGDDKIGSVLALDLVDKMSKDGILRGCVTPKS